jgi:hypothetical protein
VSCNTRSSQRANAVGYLSISYAKTSTAFLSLVSRQYSGRRRFQFHELLELSQDFPMVLRQEADYACIPEELPEIAVGQYQVEMIRPVRLFGYPKFALEAC